MASLRTQSPTPSVYPIAASFAGPRFTALIVASFAIFLIMPPSHAQPAAANYDESKVPKYTLPDPLILANGKKVTNAKAWREKRRAEILELFTTQVYGRAPGRPAKMKFQVNSTDPRALDGKASRKEVSVLFTGDPAGPKMDILIYTPNSAKGPVPGFLGLNFGGNQSVHSDPGITLSKSWMRNNK